MQYRHRVTIYQVDCGQNVETLIAVSKVIVPSVSSSSARDEIMRTLKSQAKRWNDLMGDVIDSAIKTR